MPNSTQPCLLYKKENLEYARENFKRFAWAQEIVEGKGSGNPREAGSETVEATGLQAPEGRQMLARGVSPWSCESTIDACAAVEERVHKDLPLRRILT